MRPRRLPRVLGVSFVAVVLLSMGAHPPLPPRESAEGPGDLDSVLPNLYHVKAPPRTVAETKTWLALQKVVPMNFPDETPLKDIVKFIRESTRDANSGFPKGIPIYVDPQGLQDVDTTMDAPVTIDLDGMPLGKTLRLAIRPLGLVADIDKDGLLVITSSGCNDGEPVPDDYASWQSLDMLRQEIEALREDVRALRREKSDRPTQVPANALPGSTVPGGGFR